MVVDRTSRRGPGFERRAGNAVREAVTDNPWRSLWTLEPGLTFLNHGSFGATPRPVLGRQLELRERMEADPVRFFAEELQPLLEVARRRLAEFLGADPDGLAFLANATTGINTALRALALARGDEVVVTDQEYNACRNALDRVAAEAGAKVAVARLPFPVRTADAIIERLLGYLTPRTRAVLVDHVTSQTGMVLPLPRLLGELAGRQLVTVVDGAHAPGMIDLDLGSLGADLYAGNCHKWLCAPKGAGFLWVAPALRGRVRPLVTSHGANAPAGARSRFHLEHDWTGTDDPTAYLAVPRAIEVMGSLLPGGWPELRARNRVLALAARRVLCDALATDAPCPEEMVGSLASVPLPDRASPQPLSPFERDPLQIRLRDEHRIQVAVIPWPAPSGRLLRISAQIYNDLEEYRRLAAATVDLLGRGC